MTRFSPRGIVSAFASRVRFLVVLTIASLLAVAAAPSADAQVPDRRSPLPERVQVQIEQDLKGPDLEGKDGRLSKIGRHLTRMYRGYQLQKQTGAIRRYNPSLQSARVQNGRVVVDAVAAGSGRELLKELHNLGLRRGARSGRLVSGQFPIDRLAEAAQLPPLRQMMPSIVRRPSPVSGRPLRKPNVVNSSAKVGVTTTQGDALLQTDQVRVQFNTDGSGTTVGILSDSYATATNVDTSESDDIQSGDLPGPGNPNGYTTPVNVLRDYTADDASDEGRAMAQIIHDLAPGAELAFYSAFGGGQAGFAAGIDSLRSEAGADVIVDDVIFLLEPMFQDGPVAQAVNDVTADGAVYLSSAGNNGTNGYGDAFRGLDLSGRLETTNTPHDFGGGDALQTITVPEGQTVQIVLQWSNSYASAGGPGAETDIDFYITDKQGDEVLAVSDFDNNGGNGNRPSEPIEFIEFENTGEVDGDGTPDQTFQIGIERVDGPAPDFLRYVIFGPASIDEYTDDDPSDPADGPATLYGHANAEDAIAVGASDVRFGPETFPGLTGRLVNTYSAYGGIPVVFDESGNRLPEPVDRGKPDVTGPDGVNTTFFGGDTGNDADSFPNFFGTSAAAPHIAAVAALIRSFNPDAEQNRIEEEMERTATDIVSIGVVNNGALTPETISDAATLNGRSGMGSDRRTGAGFVDAPAAALAFEILNFRAEVDASDPNRIRVGWEELESADIEGYTLRQEYIDAPPGVETVTDTSFAVEADKQYEIPLSELDPGRYEYTLRYTRTDGSKGQSGTVSATVQLGRTATVSDIFPNPVTGAQTTIRVATRTQQDIEIELFDSIGRRVGQASRSLQADRPTNLQLGGSGPFQLDMLASGVYFVRLQGDDFSETKQIRIVR
jgi:hypothetical protein